MAEARSKQLWLHTSNVLALVANVNRDPKKQKRPFTAAMFNPHEQNRTRSSGKGIPLTRENIGCLKAMVGRPQRRGG